MSDWTNTTVRDVISHIASGPSPTCEERNASGPEWGLLKTTAATWSGWNPDAHKVPPPEYWGQERLEVRRDDVIITKAGPRNRVGVVVHVPQTRRALMVSGKMALLRPDKSHVVPRLLADVLASPPSQKYLDDRTTGMAEAQTNFSNSALLNTPLRLPPLEEQRRIAQILDRIDETIRATERVIAKLEVAHVGLRRELVPEHLGDGVKEARLGDLIDPSRPIVYGILMPGDHVNGGVPVIKVKDIRGGTIADRRTLLHTSRQIDEQYARSRVREGDLLFTIRGTVGRMAFVPSSLDGANITQDTARLAIVGVNRSFLLAAMTADLFRRFVDVHTIGQAVKGINLRELRQAPVLLLPRDQQEVVGATLDDSLELIDAERRSLDKLRLLRSGLGADLLSGRIRTAAA